MRSRWLLLPTLLMLLVGAVGYLGTLQPLATVMSASMAPTIDTGNIVVLKRLRAPAQVGDVVKVNVPDEAPQPLRLSDGRHPPRAEDRRRRAGHHQGRRP